MYVLPLSKSRIRVEPFLHLVFWAFYFATINANWSENWLDRSLRPETVSQYAIILWPAIFYLHACWLLPTYLKQRKWFKYLIMTTLVLFSSEIFRCLLHLLFMSIEGSLWSAFKTEYNSYDNVIFGRLNPVIIAMQFSFAYRFSKDWLVHNSLVEKLKKEAKHVFTSEAVKDVLPEYKDSFHIKKSKGMVILKSEEIIFFQAQGDFILAIDASGSRHIINSRLNAIEQEVDPSKFFKINRSEIINKAFVTQYETYIKNRQKITLKSTSEVLYTSNSRTPAFRKWLKN